MELKKGQTYAIEFEDHGQDFIRWEILNNEVIACEPFQGSVWIGCKVLSKALSVDQCVEIKTKTGRRCWIQYPLTAIAEMPF